jgi:hypothetical protein
MANSEALEIEENLVSFHHMNAQISTSIWSKESALYASSSARDWRTRLLFAALLLVPISAPAQAPAAPQSIQIQDDFTKDGSLNRTLWTTDTPLLAALARSYGVLISPKWVEPVLEFSRSGMTMSGVNGFYQFTGIQSVKEFTPPFSVQATVMSKIASGNPFEFHLLSADLRLHLSISGNVNKKNYPYYGVGLSCNGPATNVKLYPLPDVGVWYTIKIAVDSEGHAGASLESTRGEVLGSQKGMNLGMGPFYVVLTQYEGLPTSGAGPNSATWTQLRIATGGAASGKQVREIKLGMTFSEVEALLGQPDTRVDLGEKVLYKYPNMTIEFHGGKVTDVR